MAVIAFTTAFAQPAAPTGLVLTDAGDSLVLLAWDVSTVSASIFDHYRIERQHGEAPWELAGEVSDVNDPTFTDYAAPTGALVRYRVRVSIGYTGLDSEPLEGEADTVSQWAVVVPADSTLTRGQLPIRFGGVTQTRPVEQSWPRPLGRTKPLLSEESMTGDIAAQLTVSMVIAPARQELADLVWRWERVRPWLLFKDKRGHVWRAIFHGTELTEQSDGYVLQASWSATEVA